MRVLLMCQGEQRRLAHLGIPKQLIEVNGEPILHRTIRLLGDAHEVITVGRADLQIDRSFELPDPGDCVLDGLYTALGLLNPSPSPIAILLGDVVWSNSALELLFSDPRPVVFAGTSILSRSQGEVYGCTFQDPALLAHAVSTGPCRGLRFGKQQGGHLRRLLWHVERLEGLEGAGTLREPHEWDPTLYLPIDDWTTDIDDDEDLKKLPELSKRCAEESC